MSSQREIRLNAFDMNCVGHQSPGLWAHPRIAPGSIKRSGVLGGSGAAAGARQVRRAVYRRRAGIYDVLNGSGDAAIRQATQVPVNDPLALITPMALVTGASGLRPDRLAVV